MAKINLSIYLIKEEITDFSDIVENCEELQIVDENNIIYYNRSLVQEPDWLYKFFSIHRDELRTANSKVLYLKRIQVNEAVTRIFALTFGYGRTLFKDNVIEEQFGLKIVLNTIQKNKIRKITKVDIEKNYKQSQEQMPRESDIGEFGFDIDRDLIRFVTGKSEDEFFGKTIITGGDIFNLTIDRDISNIDELLIYCYNKYKLTTYQENFEWLDNIKLVRDKGLIDRLNDEVVSRFNNGDFSQVWMAIPDLIEWRNFRCIYIQGQDDRHVEYNDIDNDVFVDSFKNSTIENFEQLKQKNIYTRSNASERTNLYNWKAYKCIVGSIEVENDIYAINGGNWYKINRDFAQDINDTYNALKLSEILFIDCPDDKNEDEYNSMLANSLRGARLIHTINIPFGSGKGNSIEPCDVIYNKRLMHIKNNGGSSYLSHLFNQATVSCQALKDISFRTRLNEKLHEEGMDEIIDNNFIADNYTVVLGIINRYHDERPKIPFFSKVSIKYAAQAITNMGYKFEIKNIKKIKN